MVIDNNCGYKNTEFGLIPENWKVMTLNEMLDSKYIIGHLDGNHGSLYPRNEEFIDKGVAYISANCIDNGDINWSNAKYLSEERASKFKKGVAIEGDVLFAHNATVGPTAILKTNQKYVILGTSLTYYRCNKQKVFNEYLKYYMLSPFFIQQYSTNMGQSTRNQVPITAQREFKFILPDLSEQIAIANVISKANTMVLELSKKIYDLTELKKALAKKLFTEGIGHASFKDSEVGRIPFEWEVKRIEEIGNVLKNSINPQDFPNIKFVHYSLPAFDNQKKPVIQLGEEIKSSKFKIDSDVVLYNKLNIVHKRVWSVKRDEYINVISSTEFIPLKVIDCCQNFVCYYMLGDGFTNRIKGTSAGTSNSQQRISPTDFMKVLIAMPSKEEQKRIVEILSKMDETIDQYKAQKNDYTQLKNGLMQQLLTGKIRVNID